MRVNDREHALSTFNNTRNKRNLNTKTLCHSATNHMQQKSYFTFQCLNIAHFNIRILRIQLGYVIKRTSHGNESFYNSESKSEIIRERDLILDRTRKFIRLRLITSLAVLISQKSQRHIAPVLLQVPICTICFCCIRLH